MRGHRQVRRRLLSQEERGAKEEVLARLCATIDPSVLAQAKMFAAATGFRNSFSAYLNYVLDHDNKQRSQLLKGRV